MCHRSSLTLEWSIYGFCFPSSSSLCMFINTVMWQKIRTTLQQCNRYVPCLFKKNFWHFLLLLFVCLWITVSNSSSCWSRGSNLLRTIQDFFPHCELLYFGTIDEGVTFFVSLCTEVQFLICNLLPITKTICVQQASALVCSKISEALYWHCIIYLFPLCVVLIFHLYSVVFLVFRLLVALVSDVWSCLSIT